MSVTPQISLVAYEARDHRVFVKVPDERGRYILTDRCVIEVACPHCKSGKGEPCLKATGGYGVSTCYLRRNEYKWSRQRWKIPVEPPDQLDAKPRYKLILPKEA